MSVLWFVLVVELLGATSAFEQRSLSLRNLTDAASTMGHPAVHSVSNALRRPNGISEDCWDDLKYLIERREDDWAVIMLDASTKVPEGVLSGTFTHLGNFDECLAVREVRHGARAFDGQHCLVSFSTAPGDKRPVAGWKMGFNPFIVKVGAVDELAEVTVRVSWCVPSTCSPDDVATLGSSAGGVQGLAASADALHCHTARSPPLDGLQIFAICFLAFFVFVAILSTIYDVITIKRETRPVVLVAFSFYSNGRRLLAVSRRGDQLHCLNGIRFISICWVLLGHRYAFNLSLPIMNSKDIITFLHSFWRLPVTNATLSVDTFFVMSGLLLSFLFLKETERTGRFDALKFYLHRYLRKMVQELWVRRLTPAVAVVVLLTVTLFRVAGTGPLWEEHMEEESDRCLENWWATLLYVQSYVSFPRMCLGFTWYLAVDMQLYWLSPLVLVPLWKWRRAALYWIAFLLLAGLAIPFTLVYTKELLAGSTTAHEEKRPDTDHYYYIPAYTRYPAWLIGIVLGYILHRARRIKTTPLPKVAVACGWLLSIVAMVGSLASSYPFQQADYEYNRVEAAFYDSLLRPLWALGVAWVIYACDRGYGGFVNTMLSWGAFQPLSRLSYGMYVTHISWLHMWLGSARTPFYSADINVIPEFFGDVVMSIVWTIPLVLLFESPVILLEKTVLGRSSQRVKQKAPPATKTNEATDAAHIS